MRHTLAIDLGTGSCRAIVFDEDGRQVAVGQREWRHAALPGYPGSQVFDTSNGWRLICECIREAIVTSGLASGEIAAVSSTSMREGMVLYDSAGREIWACPNVDARAGDEADDLVRSGAARRIFERGVSAGFALISRRCSVPSPTSACCPIGPCTGLPGAS
jgi:autoinducer 2 (AI-2) kinase